MRTLIMLLLAIVGVSHCFAEPAAGPQPYLLFNFHMTDAVDVRMLSADTPQFTFTARPRNFWLGHDTAVVQAKLLKKTSKGFRLSFSVVHSSHGRVVGRITRSFLLPWSKPNDIKTLYSAPAFTVKCFYSKDPAVPIEVLALIDLTKRSSQPLAD
ncbi:MAG TPA: hypothetical protein VGQ95_08080 [Chthoniobacterales bacterium]|nr:hypothetical protein [Chthoniobacterales bacterium]